MLTRYLTAVTVKGLNSFSPRAKTTRVLVNMLVSEKNRSQNQIKVNVLPAAKSFDGSPTITIKYKDGKTIDIEPGEWSIRRLIQEIDTHSKQLKTKDDLM